jgi:hypothetical protein
MRKSIISTLALASITSFAILYSGGPAAAKPMNSCQTKHTSCSERCINNNPGKDGSPNDGVGRCITRTCDHQLNNCLRNQAGGGGEGAGKTGPVIRDKRKPRGASLMNPAASPTRQV